MKKTDGLIYVFSKWLVRAFMRVFFGCRYQFLAPIPKKGPLIIASNHTSNLDPPSIGAGIKRIVHFMAKQELFQNPIFAAFIRYYYAVPIRRNMMDWAGIARLKDILNNGGSVILFPEGTRSKDGRLGKPKFGVGLLAQETRAAILPVYSRGADHPLAAFLRIRPMKICYGRTIPPEEYTSFEHSVKGQLAISSLVMEHIARLKEECERGKEKK